MKDRKKTVLPVGGKSGQLKENRRSDDADSIIK